MGDSNRVSFPIVGSFDVEREPKIDFQQTINMYEVLDPQAKKPRFLAPTPGYGEPIELGSGDNVRATFVFEDVAYVVSGDSVFSVDSVLTVTPLSPPTFSTSSGPVSVAASVSSAGTKEIAFVDGVNLILYNIGTATLAIIVTGFVVRDITFMDGYFIAIEADTNRWFISALNDGTTWPPLDFALVTSATTSLVGIQRYKRRLFIFGETITEVWLDSGNADFPFRRDNNLLFEHGLGSRGSLVEGFDLMFYLSRDKDGYASIMMVSGTIPRPISNEAIELQIQSFTDPSDARGFVYRINGHIFYQINFTTDNKTFTYNVNTGKWHTLEMLNRDRHTANTHMFFLNKHFIGAFNAGELHELSQDIVANDGEAIRRARVAHTLSSPVYNRIRIDRFELDLLQGVGQSNPTEDDPQVFLSISRDGGLTFKDFGTASVGKIGKHRTRTAWPRLGVGRDSIIQIEFFDKVPFYVLGASIDMEELPE